MSSEAYVTIEAQFIRRTQKAVLVSKDGNLGWLPRSTLHFASDKSVDAATPEAGEVLTLKVMEWVASERGFI